MTIIPNFILKRLYGPKSLRRLKNGVGFNLVNKLGAGELSRINGITLNGKHFEADMIVLQLEDGTQIPAQQLSEDAPMTFYLNQIVTCVVLDTSFEAGDYQIKVDVISREAGRVVLQVTDTLA